MIGFGNAIRLVVEWVVSGTFWYVLCAFCGPGLRGGQCEVLGWGGGAT